MSIEFIVRLIGMIVFCIMGIIWGSSLGSINSTFKPGSGAFSPEQYTFTMGLIGALVGLVLTPLITIRPLIAIRNIMSRISIQTLIASVIGLVIGLVFAALLAFPLSLLPSPLGRILPFVGVLFFGYFGVAIFVMRQNDLLSMVNFKPFRETGNHPESGSTAANWNEGRTILLDTSVIIDGRIADIARTGFMPGSFLIPRFILNELQFIADSSDGLRRQRGRRGMEVLSQLQKEPLIPVKISDIDVEGVHEVDDKLVILARQLRCPILTNDYNLNRVAELQGVMILNVNELANAVKSVLLPGETLSIRIIQEGKESGQGVGYMDDGTMVVVENGRDLLNHESHVTVTKILQTAAGRMIFARPEDR
jgi:uncharacterized protein YacL